MNDRDIVLYCPACGLEYDLSGGHFSCPAEGDGREHILDKALVRRPGPDKFNRRLDAGETSSFQLFRELMGSHALAGEARWLETQGRIQEALVKFEGEGFEVTPLGREDSLAEDLGVAGLWAKDETGNVTGSHKGRHLMGALLYLEALRGVRGGEKAELAVYSCGNAALAAAAVARAGGYILHAYVPEDVNPLIERMLKERGAKVEKFGRAAGQTGDPCYLAYSGDLTGKGYAPFSCSGRDNWSNIEGGETLGLEAVAQLARRGAAPDHAVVQVGGGALGRALIKAFQEARLTGLIDFTPRIHACQPEGGFPFVRAYHLALARVASRAGLAFDLDYDREAEPMGQLAAVREFQNAGWEQITRVSEFARENFSSPEVRETLADMACDRRAFMWPWDGGAPRSLAHGILDDETYDWYHLLEGLLQTGGGAVAVSEEVIAEAALKTAEFAASPVSPTGAAGVAGLMELKRLGAIAPEDDTLVLFTGAKRE